MSKFDLAYDFVKLWEGGFVMDPDDPGGATNFGISFRFLEDLPLHMSDVNQDGVLTWQDVKAMSPERAESIYKQYFWDKLRLDSFPTGLGVVLFDSAVNCGRKRAVRWLQEQLHGVEVDGILGVRTMDAALAAIERSTPGIQVSLLLSGIIDRRERHYMYLAEVRPRMEKFLGGWMNRTSHLVEVAVEHLRQAQIMARPNAKKGNARVVALGLAAVVRDVRAAGVLPEGLVGKAELLMRQAEGL